MDSVTTFEIRDKNTVDFCLNLIILMINNTWDIFLWGKMWYNAHISYKKLVYRR